MLSKISCPILSIVFCAGTILSVAAQKISLLSGDTPKQIEADPFRELIVAKTTVPPVIDGKLDDACWQTAAKADRFSLIADKKKPAKAQTQAMVTYDERNIYIGFHCEEPLIGKLKGEVTAHDGPIWAEDCVEVFVDTDNDGMNYYHWIVNSRGTSLDEIGEITRGDGLNDVKTEKHDLNWDAGLTCKTFVGKDFWSAEMSVPLAKIRSGERNDLWSINFGRERYAEKECSTWAYLVGYFHQPDRFGRMVFKQETYTATDVQFPTFCYGHNQLKMKLRNEDHTSRKVNVRLNGNAVAGEIPADGTNTMSLSFDIDRPGAGKLSVVIEDEASKAVYFGFEKGYFIPQLMTLVLRNKLLMVGDKALEADIKLGGIADDALDELTFRVIVEKDQHILIGKNCPCLKISNLVLSLDTTGMAKGDYILSVALLNSRGTVLSSSKNTFEIMESY